MELSKLMQAVCGLLSCGNDDIIESIQSALFSDRKDLVLTGYVGLVKDLHTDHLQKIFQYYFADRKDKCQDFTPLSIARLVARLATTGANTVYDLCAGSGALAVQAWAQNLDAEIICEELADNAIPVLLFNLSVRNISGYVIHRDVLTMELKAVYKLTKQAQFSDIKKINSAPSTFADAVISNPPYNIEWNAPPPFLADERFRKCEIPPASNANYAFVLTALDRMSGHGRCAFILPYGVLTSSGAEEKIRKYIVDGGFLEKVIMLPGHMFEATDIPVCVMVFSRDNQSVGMYDCRVRTEQYERKQTGQYGGVSHTSRVYRKTLNILPDAVIDVLCGQPEDVPGFSRPVAIKEIVGQGYILTPSRYIKQDTETVEHRPYEDIIDDINRICRERNVLKITVNGTLARTMGFDELHRLQDNENFKQMEKTFALFGKEPIKADYISLSKNKNELKIENKDKELFSSLLSIFIPMWRQHLFYLNQQENRLLAELRDALLPDLMSGKIAL